MNREGQGASTLVGASRARECNRPRPRDDRRGPGIGSPADAALTRAFASVYSANATGDIVLVGNSQMTCSGAADSTCGKARERSGSALNDNDFDMAFVDVDVRFNDRDDNGDQLTIEPGSLSQPTAAGLGVRGTVAIVDNKVTYTPPEGFSGVVTFTYRITDGKASDIGTVTITVENAPPVAVNDTVAVPFETPKTFPLLGNDSDPDGGSLTVTGTTAPAHGTVSVSPDGTMTYTPGDGYSGPDSFTYTINDGQGGTATATVSLTVANAVPVAEDDARTVLPDREVKIPVLENDTDGNHDADGNSEPLFVVPGSIGPAVDGSGTTRGTAVLNADGTISFTPSPGFLGQVTFPYTVSDGREGGTDTAVVTVTVVNLAPLAVDNAEVTDPATPVTVMVLDGDSDPNGDTLNLAGVTAASHGKVKINPDQTVTYTPDPTFAGIDTFSYTIDDGRGATATALVTVTVKNALPVAVPDATTIAPDTKTTIDVLANDSDPNGHKLSIVEFDTASKSGGTVTLNGGKLDYTPPPGFTGTDSFEYTISDGQGGTSTAKVTVTIPAPPVLEPAGPGPTPPGTPAPPAPAPRRCSGSRWSSPASRPSPRAGCCPSPAGPSSGWRPPPGPRSSAARLCAWPGVAVARRPSLGGHAEEGHQEAARPRI